MLKNKKKKPYGIRLAFYRTLYSQSAASLTIGEMAAVLRNKNYNIDLCLLHKVASKVHLQSPANLLKNCSKYPILIAKPNFKDFFDMFALLKRARESGLFSHVFLCGPFASLHAQSIMKKNLWVDGIIIGRPEETVGYLADALYAKKSLASVDGLLWRTNKGKTILNNQRITSLDLDALPFPARDIEAQESCSYANIEFSRGCYGTCSYCHIPPYHTLTKDNRVCCRNPKKVVDEIEILKNKYGKSLFIFNDSCFYNGKQDDKRIISLCDEIEKRKLKIHFYIYLRCSAFPGDKLLKRLAHAGLVRVFLGIENIHPAAQKRFGKIVAEDRIRRILAKLDSFCINYHIGYILFEPYTKLEEVKENIDFLHRIKKLYRIGVLIEPVRLIPNSLLWNTLRRDGFLSLVDNYETSTYSYPFQDSRVKRLFSALKETLAIKQENITYEMEYYCVSGNLLLTILKRSNLNQLSEIKAEVNSFQKAVAKCDELIYKYLQFELKVSKIQKNELCQIEETERNRFMNSLSKLCYDVQFSWAVCFAKAQQVYGKELLEEVFHGEE